MLVSLKINFLFNLLGRGKGTVLCLLVLLTQRTRSRQQSKQQTPIPHCCMNVCVSLPCSAVSGGEMLPSELQGVPRPTSVRLLLPSRAKQQLTPSLRFPQTEEWVSLSLQWVIAGRSTHVPPQWGFPTAPTHRALRGNVSHLRK